MRRLVTGLVLFVVGAANAAAHATLESASPKDGESLAMAPKEVRLNFGHEVHLTALKIIGNGAETALPVDRKAPAAKSFVIAAPVLGPGSYRLEWRALANDGHAMSGHLMFSISGK